MVLVLWEQHFGLMKKSKFNLKINSNRYEAAKHAASKTASHKMVGLTAANSEMKRKQLESCAKILSNKEEFELFHIEYGIHNGTCFDLKLKYPLQNLNSGNLLKMARGEYHSCKGWILLKNKNNYKELLTNRVNSIGGKMRHVTNGITNTRIDESKLNEFFIKNSDYRLGSTLLKKTYNKDKK